MAKTVTMRGPKITNYCHQSFSYVLFISSTFDNIQKIRSLTPTDALIIPRRPRLLKSLLSLHT